MARPAAALELAHPSRTALDDLGHGRRMIARKPVDDVRPIADVDERVRGRAADQRPNPRLLVRIFVRAQVTRRRRLWHGDFAWLSDGGEAVGPQWLAREVHLGRGLLWSEHGGKSTRVVVPLNKCAEREAANCQQERTERSSQGCRPPCSTTIARTIASDISSSTLQPPGSMYGLAPPVCSLAYFACMLYCAP